MTQLLREGLRDLAEDAPTVLPRPDAWSRGRRSHQRRVVGAVAAGTTGVVVIAAVSVGLVAPVLRNGSDTADQPSVNPSQFALPTEFSRPSPWESGTAASGPIGPLAAIGEVENRQTSWFHSTSAYYGISAVDGTYRYLDLPNLALNGTPVLSPDGSHIAYWTGSASSDDPTSVGGYAVYDTTTGAATSRGLPTLGRASPRLLVWSPASDEVMAFYTGWPPLDLTRTAVAEIFDLASGQARPLSLPSTASRDRRNVSWGPSGLSFWHPPSVTTVDPETGAVTQVPVLLPPSGAATNASDAAWNPDGSRLGMSASFADPGGPLLQVRSLAVYTGPTSDAIPPGPAQSAQRVSPFAGVYQFLGWRDGFDALVLGVPTEDLAARADATPAIYSIDVITGRYTRLASVALDETAWLRGIATGLADRAFVDRPGPPSHADPRAVWARAAALLFIAGLIVVVVLQRRRERLTSDRSDAGQP